MEIQVECLRLEGRRAVVQPEGPVARVSAKAVPALRGVEILVIPPDVDAFYGLNRFENLRIVEYGGTADVSPFRTAWTGCRRSWPTRRPFSSGWPPTPSAPAPSPRR